MNTTTEKLAEALRGLLADKYLADPINSERMAPARAALAAHDAERQDVRGKGMTARAWIEKARGTLDRRTREEDDTDLIDAHDDLCNALTMLDMEQQAAPSLADRLHNLADELRDCAEMAPKASARSDYHKLVTHLTALADDIEQAPADYLGNHT